VRKLTVDEAELTAEYGIRIGRWSQYAELGDLPFDAMWCEVPARGHSATDRHPEIELAVVVSGDATFTVDDREVAAPRGTAMLLHPNESHVIQAHDEPVRILSLYWLPEPEGTVNAS
jgi:mannose-6-phosphate isomerase-like protein (cupin superfamily)